MNIMSSLRLHQGRILFVNGGPALLQNPRFLGSPRLPGKASCHCYCCSTNGAQPPASFNSSCTPLRTAKNGMSFMSSGNHGESCDYTDIRRSFCLQMEGGAPPPPLPPTPQFFQRSCVPQRTACLHSVCSKGGFCGSCCLRMRVRMGADGRRVIYPLGLAVRFC